MSRYLIRLKPLAPYFFGGENTFRIGGSDDSYYISSLDTPSQTTIVGMLRWLLLEKNGLLDTKGSYGKDLSEYIGKKSLVPGAGPQDMGCIKSVSPLFIMDNEGNSFVRIPLNHSFAKSEDVYTPFEMSAEKFRTNHGDMRLPVDYCSKDEPDSQYIRISDGAVIGRDAGKPLFRKHIQVGINLHKNESAFFKKEYVIMESGYCYAVYADIDGDDLSGKTICYMGREKSPFSVELAHSEGDICSEACGIDAKGSVPFYYALSDLVINDVSKVSYSSGYAIVKTSPMRCLSSEVSGGMMRISRSGLRYVIRAGSVFYWDEGAIKELCAEDSFGYNKLIGLGGN